LTSASTSRAVAPPRFVTKFAWTVDHVAFPTRYPFSPTASTRRPAYSPGGFVKVEPKVGRSSGWVARRRSRSSRMSASLAATSPGRSRTSTRAITAPGGSRQVR
jgi:hypothetical protein